VSNQQVNLFEETKGRQSGYKQQSSQKKKQDEGTAKNKD